MYSWDLVKLTLNRCLGKSTPIQYFLSFFYKENNKLLHFSVASQEHIENYSFSKQASPVKLISNGFCIYPS